MATGATRATEIDNQAVPPDQIRPLSVDHEELLERGYVTVPDAVAEERIKEFHVTMQEIGATLSARHQVHTRHAEPLADLLLRGGSYRTQLFSLLKNLHVVQRMSLELVERLRTGGLWAHMGMRVPLAWPTLRADPPDEDTYLLPMHQDYASTRCHVALRGWVPLSPANQERGTMCVVVGSQELGYLDHDASDPSHPHVPPSQYQHLPLHTLTCEPGTLVLFHPAVIHGSVPNHSSLMKFVLLLQVQDLATMADPCDPHDPMQRWMESARSREGAHGRGIAPAADQ